MRDKAARPTSRCASPVGQKHVATRRPSRLPQSCPQTRNELIDGRASDMYVSFEPPSWYHLEHHAASNARSPACRTAPEPGAPRLRGGLATYPFPIGRLLSIIGPMKHGPPTTPVLVLTTKSAPTLTESRSELAQGPVLSLSKGPVLSLSKESDLFSHISKKSGLF